jgi:hypothetical protein
MSEENETPRPVDHREVQPRIPSKYPRLTPEQKKEVAKGVNDQELRRGIQKEHKRTVQFVRDKFTQDAKPIFYDNTGGNN